MGPGKFDSFEIEDQQKKYNKSGKKINPKLDLFDPPPPSFPNQDSLPLFRTTRMVVTQHINRTEASQNNPEVLASYFNYKARMAKKVIPVMDFRTTTTNSGKQSNASCIKRKW